ncbi:hypothetical protein A8139_15470 [Marinomonas primoryensis]|uniref:Uncharacterized protein n=2 Tax=Marinomonas primoryensis TaxID=178399 RepID=A0A2Z4PW21_9GAMM|nr:hypothetical protein A8139_15470 [Marinomonas primoryensis]
MAVADGWVNRAEHLSIDLGSTVFFYVAFAEVIHTNFLPYLLKKNKLFSGGIRVKAEYLVSQFINI